jgi:hypothetical protein
MLAVDPNAILAKQTIEDFENRSKNVTDNQNESPQTQPPSLFQMAKTAVKSASTWAQQGVPLASGEVLKQRQSVCEACEFWNAKAFNGTGRCMKCGCSTWAKLRMATEKCPIGKW